MITKVAAEAAGYEIFSINEGYTSVNAERNAPHPKSLS